MHGYGACVMWRIGLLLCTAFLAGCSDTGESGHFSHNSPVITGWSGTQWRFDQIDGKPPLSQGAYVSFEKDTLTVQAGCNRLEGPWHLEEDRLIAGPFDQSEAACSEGSWGQGNAVNALLAATPRMAADGNRMILQSSGHTAELVRLTH